jgi:DNA-binding LacI/PurR family transcriptional regulator
MVREAVGTAIGIARDPASAPAEPVKVVFEPTLVVRESTAPPGA